MMDKEIKQKWIEALRSGKYTQGTLRLRHRGRSRSNFEYCCLGVLGDITNINWNQYSSAPVLPNGYCGLSSEIQAKLASMNDVYGKSFCEMANFIEENL